MKISLFLTITHCWFLECLPAGFSIKHKKGGKEEKKKPVK